ncbi:MAG: dihydropteroate synthase [Pseudomonadota bacterium]
MVAATFADLDLSGPQIMGILNVTPDSFSDGGRYTNLTDALRHAETMAAEGATLIDVGGESTRPGAKPVSTQQELDRVIPVIAAIAAQLPVTISVDTSKAAVMREAVQAGASLINDVNALQGEQAQNTALALGVPVCLMHKQGEPDNMQHQPHYTDVVHEVRTFLQTRAESLLAAGMSAGQILLDPGIGFGKTLAHNLALLRELHTFTQSEHPVLIGISRKSMLGTITGRATTDRIAASVAAATLALQQGANILRVHDVGATVDALKVWSAIQQRN